MMNIKKALPAAALSLFWGVGAAHATDVFTPPEGCAAFLSVQSQSCSVNILWHCDLAPAGDKWDSFFDLDGQQSIAAYSAQYKWLDTQYFWDNSHEETIGNPADPISMTALQLTGTDTYEFDLRRTDENGTRVLHVSGSDALTGEQITIDDHQFQVIDYNVTISEEDGTVYFQSAGEQLFSPEWLVYFSYHTQVINGDEVTEYNDTPVAFFEPGDAGFANPTPLYGCDTSPVEEATPEAPEPVETGTGKNNNK